MTGCDSENVVTEDAQLTRTPAYYRTCSTVQYENAPDCSTILED